MMAILMMMMMIMTKEVMRIHVPYYKWMIMNSKVQKIAVEVEVN